MTDRIQRAEICARELGMLLLVLDDMKAMDLRHRSLYSLSLILAGWAQLPNHLWH